jgi:hypothetical protein
MVVTITLGIEARATKMISSRSILGGLHHQYGHRSTEPGDNRQRQRVIAATPERPDVGLGSE